MSNENKLIENPESVKKNFEYEENIKKIKEEISKKFSEYRTTLNYMAADAPIGILCLPKAIEISLINHGCLRIYDLFDLDFVEVKGLGVRRIGELTACLDKFFSML
jgi:hypothetical protein